MLYINSKLSFCNASVFKFQRTHYYIRNQEIADFSGPAICSEQLLPNNLFKAKDDPDVYIKDDGRMTIKAQQALAYHSIVVLLALWHCCKIPRSCARSHLR